MDVTPHVLALIDFHAMATIERCLAQSRHLVRVGIAWTSALAVDRWRTDNGSLDQVALLSSGCEDKFVNSSKWILWETDDLGNVGKVVIDAIPSNAESVGFDVVAEKHSSARSVDEETRSRRVVGRKTLDDRLHRLLVSCMGEVYNIWR